MNIDFVEEKSLFALSDMIASPIGVTEEDFVSTRSLYLNYNLQLALKGMVHRTLLTKRVEAASSPCSANCSYSLNFTGPYVQCTKTTNTSTIKPDGRFFSLPVFNLSTEHWSAEYDSLDDPKIQDPQNHSYIEISTSSPQSFRSNGTDVNDSEWQKWELDMINHYWTCVPSRADYIVHTTYKNNVRSLEVNIDETSIKPLISAAPSSIVVEEGDQLLNYTSPLLPAVVPILEDANLYSIITIVMELISGSLNAYFDSSYNSTHTDSNGLSYYNFTCTFPDFDLETQNTTKDLMAILPIAQYFSDTTISPSFSNIEVTNGELFKINEARINSMLQDVVLSMISYQPFNWTTKVDQTRNELRTIYTISRPLNLFLPYGLMLFGSLCAMSLGFYALRLNGVPAIDGGFIQLFTTAQRSDTVDRIARGGCLGGEENVPTALKDLKIQFGELIETEDDSEGAVLSTAGFGTENEIRPLKRERIYGTI